MKKVIQVIVLLAIIPNASAAATDATESARLVFDSFFHSFTNADPDGVVALFAEDALFWGTGSQSLVRDIEGIRSYFSGLGNRTPGQSVASAADISIEPLNDSLVMISGTWQVVPNGQTEGTLLRVSAVVANRNGDWKIVQFHNSRIPE